MRKTYKPPTVTRRPPGALSRKDAAVYIACSTRYLDMEAAAGRIQRVKLGAKTVYRLADLDAYLDSRLQPGEMSK